MIAIYHFFMIWSIYDLFMIILWFIYDFVYDFKEIPWNS